MDFCIHFTQKCYLRIFEAMTVEIVTGYVFPPSEWADLLEWVTYVG